AFASLFGAKVARDIRLNLFKKVESFSDEEMNRFSTASLITRSTNDITQVQVVLIIFIRLICFAPVLGIGALIMAIRTSLSMTWIIALSILMLIGVLIITMIIALPKFKIVQSLIDRLNLSMRENLSGLLVIRAFGNEEAAERRFDVANSDLTRVNLFVNRVMVALMPVMQLIMNGVSLAIVYIGAIQVNQGVVAIGDIMAFLQYAMMIIMGFLMIGMMAIMLPRAAISAGRIADVLETKATILDPDTPLSFKDDIKGLIEFNHVTFHYPEADQPVLKDITFKANPGEVTAIIGSTGSGKSTLINLIPRFYDVSDGEVKVDGIDVRQVRLHDLREHIGLVPQKSHLFGGTIRSNMSFGHDTITEDIINQSIDIAQAREFVAQLPEGIDAPIAQGGSNVSGGQKQRLAIARALAKQPEILIFDDSFSALDFKTDATLRQELRTLCDQQHTTVILVGQRIATIMDAAQILVLDEGEIVGRGSHEELLKTCQVYQEIAYSQLSKEELSHE
ncbi:MAG: ABC transporter ATP-binding protein, partial [Erysipelotrichaceae bacterium]|nr:ABC transporter ATP-binding protein [Erysipelotrichaceae bacterium]